MKPANATELQGMIDRVTNHLNGGGLGVPIAVDPALLYRVLGLACIVINALAYIEDGYVFEDAISKATEDHKAGTGGEA